MNYTHVVPDEGEYKPKCILLVLCLLRISFITSCIEHACVFNADVTCQHFTNTRSPISLKITVRIYMYI